MRCVAVTKRQFDTTLSSLLTHPQTTLPLPVENTLFWGREFVRGVAKSLGFLFSFVHFSGFVCLCFPTSILSYIASVVGYVSFQLLYQSSPGALYNPSR